MQAASNRTFICSVVFLDIVEYTKKPVAEQIVFKERLNNLLTEALADVPVNDRIILDTGDGAALSFIGDPEDALLASLSLRDALAIAQPLGPQMKLRIGINLGPVKLVKDINSHPNIIGDGINVAQRVMSFAAPGQILVSRSFHEVVSRMSDDYGLLFHYEGSRTDKHVREHEVYAVQPGVPINRRAARRRELSQSQGKPVLDRLAGSASFIADGLRHSPRVSTALTVVAILAVAVGIRLQREPTAPVAAPAATPPKVAIARPSASTKPAPESVAKAAPSGDKTAGTASARQPAAATAKTKPPAGKGQAPADSPKPSAAGGAGKLVLTVTPWGEIYVDGRHVGTTPPVYEVPLAAGSHRLEIRHPDFPAHARTVEIQAGRRVAVTHWFQPKEQPNPVDSLRRVWK
jgi:class 3 adenylate cyclase